MGSDNLKIAVSLVLIVVSIGGMVWWYGSPAYAEFKSAECMDETIAMHCSQIQTMKGLGPFVLMFAGLSCGVMIMLWGTDRAR